MKAHVKATGEIVEVSQGIYSPYQYVGDNGVIYTEEDVEILQEDLASTIDYWTRLEHQYAGMAMQGLCANYTEFTKDNDGTLSNTEMIVENSRLIAHALVEKLKEKEELSLN